MKIRVLFYVTPFKWRYLVQWKKIKKYIVNWLISLRTFSKYSHVEIWTPDKNGFTCCGDATNCIVFGGKCAYLGTAWTSTMRDEDNGTVKREASKVLKHPEHWDYVEIEIENHARAYDYDNMMAYLEDETKKNKGYAKRDLLKFAVPHIYKWFNLTDPKRNICSELGNNALVHAGIFNKEEVVSPKTVYKKLVKLGYEAKELKGN